jgi:hypothetical protein
MILTALGRLEKALLVASHRHSSAAQLRSAHLSLSHSRQNVLKRSRRPSELGTLSIMMSLQVGRQSNHLRLVLRPCHVRSRAACSLLPNRPWPELQPVKSLQYLRLKRLGLFALPLRGHCDLLLLLLHRDLQPLTELVAHCLSQRSRSPKLCPNDLYLLCPRKIFLRRRLRPHL